MCLHGIPYFDDVMFLSVLVGLHLQITLYKILFISLQAEGGSIPFMGRLKIKYPLASFIVTGVLGMHQGNEMLTIMVLFYHETYF